MYTIKHTIKHQKKCVYVEHPYYVKNFKTFFIRTGIVTQYQSACTRPWIPSPTLSKEEVTFPLLTQGTIIKANYKRKHLIGLMVSES